MLGTDNPTYASTKGSVATLLLRTGKPEEAEKIYNEVKPKTKQNILNLKHKIENKIKINQTNKTNKTKIITNILSNEQTQNKHKHKQIAASFNAKNRRKRSSTLSRHP